MAIFGGSKKNESEDRPILENIGDGPIFREGEADQGKTAIRRDGTRLGTYGSAAQAAHAERVDRAVRSEEGKA